MRSPQTAGPGVSPVAPRPARPPASPPVGAGGHPERAQVEQVLPGAKADGVCSAVRPTAGSPRGGRLPAVQTSALLAVGGHAGNAHPAGQLGGDGEVAAELANLADLAVQLATLRERAGLSRQQVADRIGRTRKSVRNWETGVFSPSLDNAAKWARVLGRQLALIPGELLSPDTFLSHLAQYWNQLAADQQLLSERLADSDPAQSHIASGRARQLTDCADELRKAISALEAS